MPKAARRPKTLYNYPPGYLATLDLDSLARGIRKTSTVEEFDSVLDTVALLSLDAAAQDYLKTRIAFEIVEHIDQFIVRHNLVRDEAAWAHWVPVLIKHGITSYELRCHFSYMCEPTLHPYLAKFITDEEIAPFLIAMLDRKIDLTEQMQWLVDVFHEAVNQTISMLVYNLRNDCADICLDYLGFEETISGVLHDTLSKAQALEEPQLIEKRYLKPLLSHPALIHFTDKRHILHLLLKNTPKFFNIESYLTEIMEPQLMCPSIDWAAKNAEGETLALILMQGSYYENEHYAPLLKKIIATHCKQRAKTTNDPRWANWHDWSPQEKALFLGLPPLGTNPGFLESNFLTVQLLLECNPSVDTVRIGIGAENNPASLLTCATVLNEPALYEQLRAAGKRHLPFDLYFKLGSLAHGCVLENEFISNYLADMRETNLTEVLPVSISWALQRAMSKNSPQVVNQILEFATPEPTFVDSPFASNYFIQHVDVLNVDIALVKRACLGTFHGPISVKTYVTLANKYPSLENSILKAFIKATPSLQNSQYWKGLDTTNTPLSFNHLINHLRGLHKTPWYCFWSAHYSGKNTASLFDRSFVKAMENNTSTRNRELLMEQMLKQPQATTFMRAALHDFEPIAPTPAEQIIATVQDLKEKHAFVNWDHHANISFEQDNTLAEHLNTVRKEAPEKYKKIAAAKTPQAFKNALAIHRGFFAFGKTSSTKFYTAGAPSRGALP